MMKLVGLIALSDPPRQDSAALVAELKELGVRTVMVTGDAPATAAIVARAVDWMVPCVHPDGSRIACIPSNFRYMPACCRRTSTSSSKHSRRVATSSDVR